MSLSFCCGSKIVNGDICYSCKEHTGIDKESKDIKFAPVVPVEDVSDEEMDMSTSPDLVSDDSAGYESDRYEVQTGDRDYV